VCVKDPKVVADERTHRDNPLSRRRSDKSKGALYRANHDRDLSRGVHLKRLNQYVMGF